MALNRFGHLVGNAHRLAVARELARIYSQVLEEPLPAELQQLLAALEKKEGQG